MKRQELLPRKERNRIEKAHSVMNAYFREHMTDHRLGKPATFRSLRGVLDDDSSSNVTQISAA